MKRWIALLIVFALAALPVVATAQQQAPVTRFANLQSAAAATGNGNLFNTSDLSVAIIQTSGTFVGTITYEATADGSVFSSLTCYTIGGSSGVTTATAAAAVRCTVAGWQGVRARVSAFTSGTITVYASGTSAPMPFLATGN